VSRILQFARENGIVEINVIDPAQKLLELEKALSEKYGLKDCKVISTQLESISLLYKKIGMAGAKYLAQKINDNSKVGIGRGRTVRESIINLPHGLNRKIKFLGLTGGLGEFDANWQPNELWRIAANKFNGECIYFYLQAVYEDVQILETIKKDSLIKYALNLWDELDWAIVGIGSISDPLNPLHEKATKEIGEFLHIVDESKPVGNCCNRLFDINGNFCKTNLDQRLVAISPEQLRKCPNVVVMAGGVHKVEAITAALKGQFINILITDALTAKNILDKK